MSAIPSLSRSSSPPATSAFSPRDLLSQDPAIAEATAKNLQSNVLPFRDTIQEMLDEVVAERRSATLLLMIRYQLIDSHNLEQRMADSNTWLLEFCIRELELADRSKEKKTFDFLVRTKVCSLIVEKHPEKLSKLILLTVIMRGELSSIGLSKLVKNLQVHDLLIAVCEEFLERNDHYAKDFQQTVIAHKCFQKSVAESCAKKIYALLESDLVGEAEIKSLEDNRDLLQELLSVVCEKGEIRLFSKTLEHLKLLLSLGARPTSEDLELVVNQEAHLFLVVFVDYKVPLWPTIFGLLDQRKSQKLSNLFAGWLSPDLRNDQGESLLVRAVRKADESLVTALMRGGANPLIRSPEGDTVFELSRNSPKILSILETCFGTSAYDNPLWRLESVAHTPLPEEAELKRYLNRQDHGEEKYYSLVVKVHEVVVIVLKRHPFSESIRQWRSPAQRHIDCWASRAALYPIPNSLLPKMSPFETLGFTVTSQPDGTLKVIELENEYRSNDEEPAARKEKGLESGFRYCYGEVRVRGHGKHPEAALAAFKEISALVLQLPPWQVAPDVASEVNDLKHQYSQIDKLFSSGAQAAQQVKQVEKETSAFIGSVDAALRCPYPDPSKNAQIQAAPQPNRFSSLASNVFSEAQKQAWVGGLDQQIETLQRLKEKISRAPGMDDTELRKKNQDLIKHLNAMSQLVSNQSVNSAHYPTLKIYATRSVVRDIFEWSPGDREQLKLAICLLISSSLQELQKGVRELEDASCWKDKDLCPAVFAQFEKEADFIAEVGYSFNGGAVQHFAKDFAAMKAIVGALGLLHDGGSCKKLFHETKQQYLQLYKSTALFLNQFWLDCSFHRVIFKDNLNRVLNLLTCRVLLMDAQIRQEKDGTLFYPRTHEKDPLKHLQVQLCLLQTSLLLTLEPSSDPAVFTNTLEAVQLGLKRSFYGSEHRKFVPLFMEEFFKSLGQIQNLVGELKFLDLPEFRELTVLCEGMELPKISQVKDHMIKVFQGLSAHSPEPQLSRGFMDSIEQSRQISQAIQQLPESLDCPSPDFSHFREALARATRFFTSSLSPSSLSADELLEKVMSGEQGILEEDYANVQRWRVETLKNQMSMLEKKLKGFQKENLKEVYLLTSQLSRDIDLPLRASCHTSFDPSEYGQFVKEIQQDSFFSQLPKENQSKVQALLSQFDSADSELPLRWQSLVKTINAFLNGKKGKELPDEFKERICLWEQKTNLWLQSLFPNELKSLKHSVTSFLDELSHAITPNYVKSLKEKSRQLKLGIRAQTYYTEGCDNKTYYLWDGTPFDAVPYHRDNQTHIKMPLS